MVIAIVVMGFFNAGILAAIWIQLVEINRGQEALNGLLQAQQRTVLDSLRHLSAKQFADNKTNNSGDLDT